MISAFFTILSILVAVYILSDAKKRGVSGWLVGLAFFGALFLPIVAIPVYLILRPSPGRVAASTDPRAPVYICSKCGAEYTTRLDHCRKCGNALSL